MPKAKDAPPPTLPADPVELYVSTRLTVEQVAARYAGRKGCSSGNLSRRSRKEGWPQLRAKADRLAAERVARTVAETRAEVVGRHVKQYRRVQRLAGRLITGVERKLTRNLPEKPTRAQRADAYAQAIAGLTREDLDALKAAATALDVSSKGERTLVGDKDDRVNRMLEAAGELAAPLEDEHAKALEAELVTLLHPTVAPSEHRAAQKPDPVEV